MQERRHDRTVPRASSLTHEHLLSILRTLLATGTGTGPAVRVLDAGCGSGALLVFLQQALESLEPHRGIDLYGLDVADHGVQASGFFEETRALLDERCPGRDWGERLALVESGHDWPYPAEFFDVVLSNQVLEHVLDPARFFAETARVLKTGGCAVHLAPVRECILDDHLGLPWAHRMKNFDLLRGYIATLNRLGCGRYRRGSGESLAEYAERHADYMLHFTNYTSAAELLELGTRAGLRSSFRFSHEYYRLKLRSLLTAAEPEHLYRSRAAPFRDRLLFQFLKYVSSVTLFQEKRQVYRAV